MKIKSKIFALSVFLMGLFSTIHIDCIGQITIFKDYSFEKNNFIVAGVINESEPNSIQENLGEFYVDDVSILDSIKRDWVFDKPESPFACGYHYTIYVIENGKILDEFMINLECCQIVTSHGVFKFNPILITKYSSKYKRLKTKINSFKSLTEARNHFETITKDTNYIFSETENWFNYDGSFKLKLENTKSFKIKSNRKTELKKFIECFKERYFEFDLTINLFIELEDYALFEIHSTMSLYLSVQNDNDYIIDGQWKNYDSLFLTSFWK
jgi:hypothetical protein